MIPLLAVHLAATWYMTGVIWLIQSVHYPMMGKVGSTFDDCQKFHLSRMGMLVGPPMMTELATAGFLAWSLRSPVWYFGLALLICIWISTFLVQVPLHNRLACGFDFRTHSALVRSNWLRTVLWTFRAVLVVWASVG